MDRELNKQKWQEIIEHQRSSGLSQKQWCEENQVNLHSFRYWVRRLKGIKTETDEVRCVSLDSTRNAPAADIVKITIGRASAEVRKQTDKHLLAEVLGILMAHAS
ncbi:hypothetical protein SANA_03540 [Gottschalkiaceae bacterium SANA]|nr:hypothetical protein SANA_03540 [Gottschalkiaceae bacterium SANA]